jgi:hypothetical protein
MALLDPSAGLRLNYNFGLAVHVAASATMAS